MNDWYDTEWTIYDNLTDWLTDWLNDMILWLTDWLNEWRYMIHWLTDWLIWYDMIHWLNEWYDNDMIWHDTLTEFGMNYEKIWMIMIWMIWITTIYEQVNLQIQTYLPKMTQDPSKIIIAPPQDTHARNPRHIKWTSNTTNVIPNWINLDTT